MAGDRRRRTIDRLLLVARQLIRPSDLRPFQQRTVDRAREALFDGGGRFLVADEVGLGKTRVAQGLIADRARKKRGSTIIVYVASNIEIARQNVRILRITDEEVKTPPRATLIAIDAAALRQSGVHLLTFTPATSLVLRKGVGIKKERALLAILLQRAWKYGLSDDATLDVFRGQAKRPGFATEIQVVRKELRDAGGVDEKIEERFRQSIQAHEDSLDRSGQHVAAPGLRARFNAFRRAAAKGRQGDEKTRSERNRWIGELRDHLAKACLAGLRADLVILDEFQRFGGVLSEALERETLSHLLTRSPTLLLSATPYRVHPAEGGLSPQQDLMRLMTFLVKGNAARVDEIRACFSARERALTRLNFDTDQKRAESVRRAVDAKRDLEKVLRKVMSRWERPALDEELTRVEPLELRKEDVESYIGFQSAVEIAAETKDLERPQTVEYWKSAPYLANFMRGYQVKEAIEEAAETPSRGKVLARLSLASKCRLPWSAVDNFEPLEPPNARMRFLLDRMHGQQDALWVPPALPPYRLRGAFETVVSHRATKQLVFSAWTVVPPTVAALVSYEAERRSAPRGVKNARAERKQRSSRQPLSPKPGRTREAGRTRGDAARAQRAAVLALTYPCVVLASAVDPYSQIRSRGELPSLDQVLLAARRRIAPRLRSLGGIAARKGRGDPTWYWAAPLLLDREAGIDVEDVLARIQRVWSSSADTGVDAMVDAARRVLRGAKALGPRPRNLVSVLAQVSVGAFGTCSLRSLSRVLDGATPPVPTAELQLNAARAAWGIRTMMNRGDATLVWMTRRSRQARAARPYWRDALDYCCDGALQGVLDEYFELLTDDMSDARGGADIAKNVARTVQAVGELEALRVAVDDVTRRGTGAKSFSRRDMSSRFAAAFGANMTAERADETLGDIRVHPERVRSAFNSPFWPWILVTTSIGQEGLDFHRYCHEIVHWNVPSTAVELEQREGRINRFRSHVVRRNRAEARGREALAEPRPWRAMFTRDPQTDKHEFEPDWTSHGSFTVRSQVPLMPYTRDQARLDRVRDSRVYYRLVLGQPNPKELVDLLMSTLPSDAASEVVGELTLDLTPVNN